MGFADGHTTARAGNYLLLLLAKEQSLEYSRFYDATDETRESLLDGMGLSDPEIDRESFCAEVYMDIAVCQLEDEGLLTTRETGDILADGEPNHEIALTQSGREFVAAGKVFSFYSMDL